MQSDYEGQLCQSFEVKTRVKQGRLLSPFFVYTDCGLVNERDNYKKNNGVQWTDTLETIRV